MEEQQCCEWKPIQTQIFQSDVDNRSSNFEYVFTLNGGAISWKSKKQDVIVDSMTEAEYVAATEAGDI